MPSTKPGARRRGGGPPSTARACRAPWRGRRPPRRPRGRARRRSRRACRARRARSACPPAWATATLRSARAGLAGVDQRLKHAVDVVGDLLALEDADGDRVGAGVRRGCVCRGSTRMTPTSDGGHASNRDPWLRPHPCGQARRRTFVPAPHRPRRHRHQGRARTRGGRAGAGPARGHGPRAAGGTGQIPSRQAQIKAGIPKEVSSETINKVCASGIRAAGLIDQAVRAGDLDVGGRRRHGVDVAGARTCCRRRASGSGWATSRRSTRWSRTGCATRSAASRCSRRRPRSATQLEMTRADLDKWALRSHERTIAATDEGRLPEEIVAGHDPVAEGRHGGRGRRGAAARHVAGEARRAARAQRQGRLAHRRQLAGRQRRRRRAGVRVRRVGRARGQGGARHDRRPGGGGRRVRVARPHARQRGARRRSTRRACSRATSTCGRSTRRSPR